MSLVYIPSKEGYVWAAKVGGGTEKEEVLYNYYLDIG